MKQKDVLPDKKLTCKNVLEKLVRVSQTLSGSFCRDLLLALIPAAVSGSG